MPELDIARVQRLIDRQDILDCLNRYSRGVDRFDREMLLSAYHPDARDDHGGFVGTREQFADSMFNAHNAMQKRTMHFLGNHRCEFDGDTVAHTETYCMYFGENRDGTIDLVSNRYLDRFEKRDGDWRIADRICVVEWLGSLKSGDEVQSVLAAAMPALMTNAPNTRDRNDVSYQRPLRVTRESAMPARMPEPA